MSRLEEDLFRHRFFDMPNPSPVIFDPQRRSRLFDALFSFDDVSTLPSFHINPTKNQVECQVPTGCGDFFRPEDVELNVNGRIVELKARREQKFPDGHSYVVREVGQLMTVPENADIDRLQAELAPNGKLMISAPLLTPASALESPKPDGPVPIKINQQPDNLCSRCRCSASNGDRRPAHWPPFDSVGPTSIVGWFNNQVSRLQDDLFRHRFFDMPNANQVFFDPQRRSRLFDALFSPTDEYATLPEFHTNPTTNQVECQLPTGCGDFFRPEDVVVNVTGRNVEFKARREQKSDDGHSYTVREVRRMVSVPENADVDRLQAEFSPNGKLTISAPLLTPPEAIEPLKSKGPVPIKINRL
ncbi:hypothetical protein BIW11_04521 [Tropilaelaps mercedesae]|uniref:SHSP domain-containing protein n=1 Tax=Tropilaelaps mercedesae TaxID=418985 RepID=A0A1V9X4V9_9ACAR|nr:hypothetical protein BIW11_04521 [Tropilaelaps mercedesae]